MFCLQLNYDGLDDDDDDDQFSSVYCFAIKIYKTRSSKYLKANGKEAHGNPPGFLRKELPQLNITTTTTIMTMMMMIKITISICGYLTNAYLLLT